MIPSIDTGGGGLSNSSGVSGFDKQNFGGSQFGGITLGNFGSSTKVTSIPSWVWLCALLIGAFVLIKGR